MIENISVLVDGKSYYIPKDLSLNQIIDNHFPDKKDAIVGSINGILCDLSAIVSKSAELCFYNFDTKEGKETFHHSSAHILGNALVNLFKCKLVNGPATEEGFYYDVYSEEPISSESFNIIEKEMAKIVKRKEKFCKVMKSKEELLDLYKDNMFKTYFINKFVDDRSSVYMNGEFYDMCLGPHVKNTGEVRAFKLTKTSSAYFLNDSKNASLQRIYGVSFPSKELLKEYLAQVKRAQEMDHRKVGRELDLFFFHKYSPGSCFWLPDGAHIYNKLMDYLRSEYRKRGFKEVITPNIFSVELWKKSGHYDNYKDNIYMLESEDFALKPMNCPGHCLIFANDEHTFRDLPIRYADFGVLHRNECSGSLSGLTRVRRFQQDDAHIFCTREQIRTEIGGCLEFVKSVYKLFGFEYELFLSTRPDKFIGEISEWEHAEDALRNAITESGAKYVINSGDGAFYGPKIDIILKDAFGRKIQCATIQLDFQLPQRFELKYKNADCAFETPVIIHRAIFGSIERMISIIIESFGKKLPFWLTSKQIAIISVSAENYVAEVVAMLSDFEVKVFNKPGFTLSKNIRNAETGGYRIICILGKKEALEREVNVRYNGANQNIKLETFIEILKALVNRKIEFDEYSPDISSLTI